MIRIGLVGEDPNDTSSIKNLLLKKYKGRVQFYPLAKRILGHQLDNPKIKKSLPIEFADHKCNFILYIRDLDGFVSETHKINKRQKWFKGLDAIINGKGIFLLNIWELEALILADINTFNEIFRVSHKYKANPMFQQEPKELLKRITGHGKRTYRESNCPEIFEKLNFDTVESKCAYFKEFVDEFDKRAPKES